MQVYSLINFTVLLLSCAYQALNGLLLFISPNFMCSGIWLTLIAPTGSSLFFPLDWDDLSCSLLGWEAEV